MGRLVHSYRKQWSIAQFCDCPEGLESNKAIEATSANSETNGGVNSASNGICKVVVFLNFVFVIHFTEPYPNFVYNRIYMLELRKVIRRAMGWQMAMPTAKVAQILNP